MTKYDPWAEQDAYEQAIEKGAVYTCPRSGWKIKVRHFTDWSPYPQKANAIVMARQENIDIAKKVQAGEKLTKEEEVARDNYLLELGIRSILMGWSGVTDRNKKKVEFNLQNAIMVFGGLKRMWGEVNAFAFDPANFGITVPQKGTEVPDGVDATGNSSATSDSASEDSADS